MQQMMRQAQEAQKQIEKVKEQLAETAIEASSGGGMVEAVCTGRHEVKSIKMNPEIVDPEDIDMLEDMILAAVNEALRKASDKMEQEMARVQGGLSGMPGIPGLF